jgi:hypothetical protein
MNDLRFVDVTNYCNSQISVDFINYIFSATVLHSGGEK